MELKALSLFSGIGGLDLAAEMAGIETAAFCEIEPFPVEVLKKRFPDVPIFGDVRKLKRGDIDGTIDIIHGGFPCQDLSQAGKQRGLEGERSGLWFEMLRVIHEIRPRYVLAENVRGAVNLALDTVYSNLVDEGYKVYPYVISASAVGAPHQRERLFVVGVRADVADAVAERLQGGEWRGTLLEQGEASSGAVAECGEGRLWPTPKAGACGMTARTSNRPIEKSTHLTTQVYLQEQKAKMWPTPRAKNTESYSSDGFRPTLAQCVPGESKPAPGQLSPLWVECLMNFPEGWTDLDVDEPKPWQGWPALLGENILWATPNCMDTLPSRSYEAMKKQALNGARKNRSRPGNLREQIDPVMCKAYEDASHENGGNVKAIEVHSQYPYEFPRTTTGCKDRAKRLKALGNAVVPAQAYPFFRAIVEIERVLKEVS